MNQVKGMNERTLDLINAALTLQRVEEYQQATEILQKVLEIDPAVKTAYLLLALNAQKLGSIESAESYLRQALKQDPNYPEALQTLGLMLTAQGRSSEAIPLLKTHLAKEPGDPQTLQALTSALLRLGETDEALRILKRAWEQTQEEEPGVQYGRLLIQLEKLDEAENVLQRVKQVCPCPRTLAELALILILKGDDKQAADVLEQAVELDPMFDRAWRGLAGCYDRLGKYERALAAADQALRLDPQHYRNWMAKAGVLLSLDKPEDALTAARHGIELITRDDPEARPVLQQLLIQEIRAWLEVGVDEELLSRLDEVRSQFPEVDWFARVQADLLHALGNDEKALTVVAEAESAGATMTLAKYRTLHALGRSEEAWQVVEAGLAGVAPEVAARRLESLLQIHLEFYLRGDVDTAFAILEQLREVAPDHPMILNNLGFMYIGKGDLERTQDMFQRLLTKQDAEVWHPTTSLNLGYVHLVKKELDKARAALHAAEEGFSAEGKSDHSSIGHIAYWRDGEIIPDPVAYPMQFSPSLLLTWANRVTLLMAEGKLADAEHLAEEIITSGPEVSIGYRVLGCVALSQGESERAREVWEKALDLEKDPAQREVVSEWLSDLFG